MAAIILDGKQLAETKYQQLSQAITQQVKSGKSKPTLTVILVGDDPASITYVNIKQKQSQFVGIETNIIRLNNTITQAELIETVRAINQDTSINGILIQQPLPSHIDTITVVNTIDPNKDVDGLTAINTGLLAQQKPKLRPCTPYGIMQLLAHYQIKLTGIHTVIVGDSNIVGRPMAFELLMAKASVTTCNKYTENLEHLVKQADLLIVAIGKPNIVLTEWIKSKAIVIDVGINFVNNRLMGDIDFDSCQNVASMITPVPGGVGPMTVATLLSNTYQATYNEVIS